MLEGKNIGVYEYIMKVLVLFSFEVFDSMCKKKQILYMPW